MRMSNWVKKFRFLVLIGIIFELGLGPSVALADSHPLFERKKVQRLDQRDFRSLFGLNRHKKQNPRMASFERALNYFQVLLNGQAIQEIRFIGEDHYSKAGVDSKRASLAFILSFKKWVDLGVSPTLLIQTWLLTKYRFARLGMEKWLKENPTITPKSFASVKASKSLSLERKKNIIILHHLKSIQSFIKIRDWEGLKKSKTYQWFADYGKVDKKRLKKIKMPEVGLKTLDEILYKLFVNPTINGMLTYSKALKWTPPKKGHQALHYMRMSKAHEELLENVKKVFPGAIKVQEKKDGKTIQVYKDEQTRKWIKEKKELQKKIKPKEGEEWYQTVYRAPVRLFEINSDVWGGTAVLLGSLIVTQDWDESQAAASVVIDANRKFSNKYAGFSVHGTDLEFARPAAAKNDWKLVAGDMIHMQPIAQIMGGAAGALESFYWLFRQGKMRIKGMDKERLRKAEEEGKVSKIPDYIFHGLMFLAGGAGLYRMFMKQAKRALGAFVANPETMKWLATYMAKKNLKKVVGVAVGMGATSSFGSELYQSGVGKKGFQIKRFSEGTLHSSSQSLIFMAAMLKATSMMMAKGNYSQESVIKSAVFAKVADFGEGLADVPDTLKMMAMAQNTQQMIGAGIVLGVNAFDTMDISVSGALKAINPIYVAKKVRGLVPRGVHDLDAKDLSLPPEEFGVIQVTYVGKVIENFGKFTKRFSLGRMSREKRKQRNLNDLELKKRQEFNMDELPLGQTKDGEYTSSPGTRGYEAVNFLISTFGLVLSPQARVDLAQIIEKAHKITDSSKEQENLLTLKFLRHYLSEEHALALMDEGYCGSRSASNSNTSSTESNYKSNWKERKNKASQEIISQLEGSTTHSLPAQIKQFVTECLAPVLLERVAYAAFSYDAQKQTIHIESPMGDYQFIIDSQEKPSRGLPEVEIGANQKASVHFSFSSWGLDKQVGQVRSAFRADPYLHPHMALPQNAQTSQPRAMLSLPQQEAVEALLALEAGKGNKRGLVMPVGMGKTVTSAKYIEALGQKVFGGKTPKVIFVVENQLILEGAIQTYQRELNIESDKVQRIFGSSTKGEVNADSQMIAITRSSYHSRMNDIHKLLKDSTSPWVVVIDEAHHVGRGEGQFEKIIEGLDVIMGANHRMLLLSATLWHEDAKLVRDILQGHVYGVFLTEQELADLKQGKRLQELCRIQLYRAIEQGFLSPFYGFTMIRYIGGIEVAPMLRGETSSEEKSEEDDERKVVIYEPLIQDIALKILDNLNDNVSDRGIIFAPSRAHADIYAKRLSEHLEVEVRPFHRGEGVAPDTLDWFQDQGEHSKTRSQHKYLVVVDLLNEGVDLPNINLVINVRTIGGFRRLIQNVGRGTRVAPGKPDLRLIDYSGALRLLRDAIGRIGVTRSGKSASQKSTRKDPNIVVDEDRLDINEFVKNYHRIFDTDSFEERFPDFDHDTFRDKERGALAVLRKAYTGSFSKDFGAKKLIEELVQKCPESKRASLQTQIEGLDWKKQDGGNALQPKGTVPAQRIYQAWYWVAETLQKDGHDIDLDQIHTKEGAEQILGILYSASEGHLTQDMHTTFRDNKLGALAVLRKAYQGNFGEDFGAKKLMEELVQKCPECKRAALQTQIDGLDLKKSDGRNAKKIVAAQRIYRAWYWIAEALKKEGHNIDLNQIHTKEGAEQVLDILYSASGSHLTQDMYTTFRDKEAGALAVLREAYTGNIRRDFGAKKLIEELVQKCPESKREALQAQIEDLDWKQSDGGNAFNSNIIAAQRIYQAWYWIAEALKNAGHAIDLSQIYTREGAEQILGILYSASGGHLTQDMHTTFRDKEKGALAVLRKVYTGSFTKEFGAKKLMEELAQKCPESKREALQAQIEGLDWKQSDGAVAPQAQVNISAQRIYQAWYWVAEALNKEGHNIDLDQIHTKEEAEQILGILYSASGGHLTQDMHTTFRDKEEGALAVLRKAYQGNFSKDFGAKKLIEELAKKCPERMKPALLKKLEGLDMKKQDGSHAALTLGSAAVRRIYQAWYWIAEALKNSGHEIDLSQIHTREEAEKVLENLYPSRESHIELTEEMRTTFRSKTEGALAVLRKAYTGSFTINFGAKKLMEELAKKCAKEERATLLRQIERLGLKKYDGGSASQASGKEAAQRIYQAFYGIAGALKKAGHDINLDQIHTKEEAEKIIRLLK